MSTPVFNYIDIAAIVMICLGAFVGYRRKLSGELAILLSIGAAFFIGIFFYAPIGNWLVLNTKLDVGASRVATYVFLVLAAGVVMVALRIVLGKFMNLVIGEKADRIGGLIAGTVKALIMVLIVFLAMSIVPNDDVNANFGERSLMGRLVIRFIPTLDEVLDEGLEEKLENAIIDV